MRLYPAATDLFLSDPTSRIVSPASHRATRTVLRALQRAHPDKTVDAFTEEDLVALVARPGLAPATRAGYRSRLTGFFSWALWKGHIPTDPSANLGRLVDGSYSMPVREHHWLSTSQVTEILDSVDTSTDWGLRAMVLLRLGFTMGLRRVEIVGLRWDQLDLDSQQARLSVTKGGKLAATFITDATVPWLRKWHDRAVEDLGRAPTGPVVARLNSTFTNGWRADVEWGHGVEVTTISHVVKQISQAAGHRFAPHDMRRSYAKVGS